MLVVQDILATLQAQALGTTDPTTTYDRLNRAISVLKNKQPTNNITWDPQLTYVNITTSNSYFFSLPPQIEKPIMVNINSNPAFSRGPMYEFTMNGPGSTDPLVGFQWMDNFTRPYQQLFPSIPQLPTSQQTGNTLYFTTDNPIDYGVAITVTAVNLDGSESQYQPILAASPQTIGPFLDITVVTKPQTQGNISLFAGSPTMSTLISKYTPSITAPQFTWLKISQQAASVRVLAKRKTFKVSLPTDFIPLNSSSAIILAVKAIKYYDEDNYGLGDACLNKAVEFLNDEQSARMMYTAAAQASQTSPALNINIANRDCVVVGDIYDDACTIFGSLGQQKIFDKITLVVETMRNFGSWEPDIGYCDITASGGPDGNQYYLTLPQYVEQVLAFNVNGMPGNFRNKWFEFHLDGLWQDNWDGKLPNFSNVQPMKPWTNRPPSGIEEIGEVVTAFDPLPFTLIPLWLVAVPQNPADQGSNFRVYGFDTSNLPVYDSNSVEGFNVPVGGNYSASPPPGLPLPNSGGNIGSLARVTRITKDATQGFIDLWTTDGNGNLITFLGTYWPDQTEPKFMRVKLGLKPMMGINIPNPVVRIRYAKRWKKFTSLTDPIHLRSRLAILTAMNALSLINLNAPLAPGQGPEMVRNGLEAAKGYLEDEWKAMHPREGLDMQFDRNTWPSVFDPMV